MRSKILVHLNLTGQNHLYQMTKLLAGLGKGLMAGLGYDIGYESKPHRLSGPEACRYRFRGIGALRKPPGAAGAG
jgi:hypothetical protein